MKISDIRKSLHISTSRWEDFLLSHPHNALLHKDELFTVSKKPDIDFGPLSFESIEVVYEDEICIIVNKPPFLLVHSDGNTEDTLQARVNAYLNRSHPYKAGVVHRIDTETSGLVLFCKNPLFQSYFDDLFAGHDIEKYYLAVLEGVIHKKNYTINKPIGRNRHEAKKMMVIPTGKDARTEFHVLNTKTNLSLVEARIYTGRKHQIRVHAAWAKHPVYNDSLYGTVHNKKGLMLECSRLVFTHPLTKEKIDIAADLDPRFISYFSDKKHPDNTR
ncbi:MAG: RluA family pseudouridine synthase [Faecalicoccus sp.]|nr:RluA family pseudouridine synthase [Faecalicoccus sp.]